MTKVFFFLDSFSGVLERALKAFWKEWRVLGGLWKLFSKSTYGLSSMHVFLTTTQSKFFLGPLILVLLETSKNSIWIPAKIWQVPIFLASYFPSNIQSEQQKYLTRTKKIIQNFLCTYSQSVIALVMSSLAPYQVILTLFGYHPLYPKLFLKLELLNYKINKYCRL